MKLSEKRFLLPIVLGLLGCFLLLVQSERIGSVGGVEVNFLLVFFSLLVFLADSVLYAVVPILVLLLFSFFSVPFWIEEILILAALILPSYFARRFLTGNSFVDFLIVIFLATVFFYGALALFFHTPWLSFTLFLEVIYNCVLGALVWAFVRFIKTA